MFKKLLISMFLFMSCADAAQVTTKNIENNAVDNTKLSNIATSTVKGRTTAGTGDPEDLTTAQLTTLINSFTSGLSGAAPASGGGTTNFLRADGTWASPGGGANTELSNLGVTEINASLFFDTADTYDVGQNTVAAANVYTNFVNSPNSLGLTSQGSLEITNANDAVYLIADTVAPTVFFYDDSASFAAGIKAPGTLSADYTLTLPLDDGTASQVLTTNGSGVLSWNTAAATFPLLASPVGTAAAPAYSFSGDSDTGIYSSTLNTVDITLGGTQEYNFGAAAFVSPGANAFGTTSNRWGNIFSQGTINVGASSSSQFSIGTISLPSLGSAKGIINYNGNGNLGFMTENSSVTIGSDNMYFETGIYSGTTAAIGSGSFSKKTGAVSNAGSSGSSGSQSWSTGNVAGSGNSGGFSFTVGTVNSGTRGQITSTSPIIEFIADKLKVPTTITAGGTTGNQTIDKISGTVNFAAAGTTLTVTNSTVTANSIVMAVARTNDATCSVKNVVPAAGSFVINVNAACTAETSVGFFVVSN